MAIRHSLCYTLLNSTLLAAILAGGVPAAMGADLVEVYAMAEASDPAFRRVAAAKRAILEQRPQALAQLLPSLSVSARSISNDQEISSPFIIGDAEAGETIEFNTHGYSLDLTQPIFRRDRWVRLRQADSSIRQADAELTAAEQDLMFRVSQSYFNVLAAMDTLQFAQAEQRSLSRQLEQAKQRFEVGLTAITDVQEAQAGYDRAVAQEIAATNAVDNAREALREITGEYLDTLTELGDGMPLVEPTPGDIDAWTATAIEQNLNVAAALHAVDVGRQEIKAQWAGHLPTLDLVGSLGYDSSGGRFGGTRIHADSIGVQLNVPLFQGGFVSSRTREARQRLDEDLERLELARRAAHRQTREAYLGVISGISQVNAFKQAVVSSETALQATEAGFEVGTRTAVDVVAAERVTSQARRDFARAKYDYILNTVRLKQAAGTLTDQDLALINAWLE